jgi:hypothetical protein
MNTEDKILSLIETYGQNKNIQTAKTVMQTILMDVLNRSNPKMLVFGLGYDSALWYNATNCNTFFVEDNKKFIEMNDEINKDKIVYYKYDTKVADGLLSKVKHKYVEPPTYLLENGSYDIIFIDGPAGWNMKCPGRVLPIFWCEKLLNVGGTVYIDDANRDLEKRAIENFLVKSSLCVKIAEMDERDGLAIFQKKI